MRDFQIKTPTPEELQTAHDRYMDFLHNNPNNFSIWFPRMKNVGQHGIKVPESHIVDVPEDVYIAFVNGNTRLVRQWIHKAVLPVIQQHFDGKEVFVKNGCYSGKFYFNKCCHIPAGATLKEIAEHLCELQYNSVCKDTGGALEIVIREWIKPENFTETIYDGMPLRPEIRLFYDFTNHKPLYWVNYWDWDYCHDAICRKEEDRCVYEKVYPSLCKKLTILRERYWETIVNALQQVTLMKGLWSVDFILEQQRVWMIDAAIAPLSAYWDPAKAGITPEKP